MPMPPVVGLIAFGQNPVWSQDVGKGLPTYAGG